MQLDGPLDPKALRRAAERLTARHEILRTIFHRRPGLRVPFQVLTEGSPSWEAVELSGAGGTDPIAAAEELLRQEVASPFDLERGPLFRLRLGALSQSRHVLLFTLPTLCADRETLHNIASQLADLYGGEGGERDLEAPIQYADFSQWQYDLLETSDETAEMARSYWRQKSADNGGGSVPFETIGDDSGVPAASEFLLRPALLRRIDAFCREEEVSTADFLLACWQMLLWRTTDEAEVLVGNVHNGRKFEELKNALGLFARALPLRARFDENPRFSQAVKSSADARRQNEEWQEYFGREEDLELPAGNRTPAPGFEFWQQPELPETGGVSFTILCEFAGIDRFPVWLTCAREADHIRISFVADGEHLPGEAAQRLRAHLETLIEAAAENPRARTGELPILPPGERRRLLVDFNQTRADFPRSRSIHELFEEQVERTPDAPAVVFGSQRLTYADLNARANALAWQLVDRGAGPDVPVGLAVDRSADMIVALLAILKAGGAYVPLNPEHPGARLSLQLTRSASRLVVTQSRWLEKFADFAGERICLDSDPQLFGGTETRNPQRRAGPSSLAYIMHTSGSTGVPKGVAVQHESLVNYAHFVARDLLGIDPAVRTFLSFATVSTLSADLGNTSIFPSLISGGCLHVVDYETATDGGFFAGHLSKNPIDVLKIVPTHLAALLSSGGGRGILPRRFLILGGEALSWELVERIRSLGGSCEIINHYGPTETTVGSLTFRVPASKKRGFSAAVPIGRPIANTEVFVLDAFQQPVPVGVPGELHIGGVGLARGYCNESGETAEKFVRHPFSQSPDARLYRTGDRVRYLADGNVEFLGRMDDQVKIRGFRIEPGEVQAVLAAHPGVRESVVLAREDSPAEKRLVAYIVPARGAALSSDELRGWVKRQLPDYMVPSAFVLLKTFPLTPNGKVDRHALPAPEEVRAERPYVAPRTPAERVVSEIWADVLRIERVGAEDNFFDLGGHSLLVTQVVSRMRKAFERELPIRWVFEFPTVAQLAARAEAAEREEIVRILDVLESLPEKESGDLPIGNEPYIGA